MSEGNAYSGRKAMQVQLSRLFGSESRYAKADKRTAAEWRKTLKAVLGEMERYVAANVDTDDFHKFTLLSGLWGASEALKEEDFWPGYVEGITRVGLILLGDYPDHRKRKLGRKLADHYKLDLERTVQWTQTPEQRLSVLIHAERTGFPVLSERPLDVLRKFRDRYGFKPTQTDFLEWYRANFPRDYAAVFR
ncbi:MAG: hypothetical protein ACYCO5_03800 [Acidobacteriaceae bacterium]